MSDDDEIRWLNRKFYENSPATYFRDRLQMLILRAAHPNVIDDAIGHDTKWGQLQLRAESYKGDSGDVAAEKEAARSRFLVAESQVLLHHVGEALLRMYLAHERHPLCPWMEIVAYKNQKLFREQVAEIAADDWPEVRTLAAGWVFLGGVPKDDPLPSEWTGPRDRSVRLLRIIAERINGDSLIYNAAKHGFTAISGTGGLSVRPVDDAPPEDFAIFETNPHFLTASGVTVAYLEREGTPKKGYEWYENTLWANPEKDAWLIHLAIIQMEALWTIARCRYLREPAPEGIRLVGWDELETYDQFPYPSGGILSTRRWVGRESLEEPEEATD